MFVKIIGFLNIIFIFFIILSILTYILALSCIIIFPKFNNIPRYIMYMTSLIYLFKCYKTEKSIYTKIIHIVIMSVLLFISITLLSWILTIIHPREFHTEYPSPNNNKTIVVEYDFSSRPIFYKKYNLFFMKKINVPVTFIGYNETVLYDLEWISENLFIVKNSKGDFEFSMEIK